MGESIEKKDPTNTSVYTFYYPDGKVKEVYSSAHPGYKTKLFYNSQGRRITIDDPDAGRDSSYYDAFGNLIWNINDKGDSISFAYDDLGRKLKATDNRGDIHYVYHTDTTSASFGKVDSLYSSDGTLSEWFTYDNTYGRLLTSSRRFLGKTFTNSYSYDWFGRPMTRTYPSGFEIQYTYKENGILKKISGNRRTLWECNDVNALGQITSYAQGDYTTTVDYDVYGMLEEITTGTVQEMRYAFDDAGNLSWREDVQTNQKEIFTYDDLSRLTSVDYYLNGNHDSSGDLDISYDDGGIITSKSDVGGTIHYGENGAGPHALTSVVNPVSSYTPPPQRITYTDFNKVHTIQDTVAQDTTLTLSFWYGLNNQRVKTRLSENSSVQRVKYFHGDYEEDSTATGTKKYHYIHAPTGLVGIFVQDGGGNDTLYHVLTDHMGSLTAVINAQTDAVTLYSYNAWGMARDPQDWTRPFEGELFAGRGYTGHEHLQAFSLINMNGRVYDPVLARFLSPDPFVQFPGIADGWNRYSYVMNNPLKFTDPTGLLTQDEYDQILWELLTSDHGGYWKPGMSSPYLFIDGEEAGAAGQQYMSEHGYGGGGSWRPVYNLSVETSGRLGGFVQTGLIGGPKYRWRHGNFQISFSSDIVGWRWVSSEESIFTIDFFSVDAFEDPDFSFSDLVKPRDENITGLVPSKNNSEREYPNTYIGRWANYTRIPEITMDNQSQANEQIQNFLNQANQAIQDYNTQVYDFYRDFNDPLYAIRSRRLDIASGLFLEILSWPFDFLMPLKYPDYPFISPLVPDPNYNYNEGI